MTKKLLCLILSALLCLSFSSCKGKEQTLTETSPEPQKTETEETKTEEIEIDTNELLGEVESWLGYADTGNLTEPGCYETRFLTGAEDFAPYRSYFPALTSEDEAKMLEDTEGKILLVEMTGDTKNTLYSTSNITRTGNNIDIFIYKCESEEDILPLHTYFLFHFSSDVYHGEEIAVFF